MTYAFYPFDVSSNFFLASISFFRNWKQNTSALMMPALTVPQHSPHSLTFPCGFVSELPGRKKKLSKKQQMRQNMALPANPQPRPASKFSLLFKKKKKSLHWTFSWPDIFRRTYTLAHSSLHSCGKDGTCRHSNQPVPNERPAASALKSTVKRSGEGALS